MFSFNAVLRKMCGGFKGINLRKAEKSTKCCQFSENEIASRPRRGIDQNY